jgi:hypothetical protein
VLLAVAGRTQTPAPTAPLPERLQGLARVLVVNHFPNPVHPSLDPDKPGLYFWKHTTSVLSDSLPVRVTEFGAFLFYNAQWNLRAAFKPRQLNQWFGTRRALLKAGQPYTFENNWRTDTELRAGWALWYFIGNLPDGRQVCGYEMLDTTPHLLNP